MITHSCSSQSAQPLRPYKSIYLHSLVRFVFFTFLANDICSDLDQTALYLCAPHSHAAPTGALGTDLTSAAVYHDGTRTCNRTNEGALWGRETEKLGAKTSKVREERISRLSGKWIKTEACLMFVGGILKQSRGDVTPSVSSSSWLHIYEYLHPNPDRRWHV